MELALNSLSVVKLFEHQLINLNFPIVDCGTCYDDILKAVTDCTHFLDDWLTCIEDISGAGIPCIDCVCEVINDISSIFGLDWNC